MEADKTIDAKGLNCPMPIIRIKKALSEMQPGQILRMEATDKGSKSDVAAFASRTGNELLEVKEEGGTFIFFLKKK
ncbi:MAG: sulfurtransferase TusA family protein [Nitrospirae bacterium]|nr:sulfurtransferase TusA family protein [Nitrospirota bacterium]